MKMHVKYCCWLMATLTAFFPQVAFAEEEGVLHTFYSFELQSDGRSLAHVKTSNNVVLGTPITETFDGLGKFELTFEQKASGDFTLVLSVREAMAEQKDKFDLPVQHAYDIALNEELQITIDAQSGLKITAIIKLEKVSRLEVAT